MAKTFGKIKKSCDYERLVIMRLESKQNKLFKIQIKIVLVFILSRYWFKSIILDLFWCATTKLIAKIYNSRKMY